MDEEIKKVPIKARIAKTAAYMVGLISLKVLGLILVEIILLALVLLLDPWKGTAFVLQFPASLFIWLRWKQ